MIPRPKPGETDEDILNLQEEFLKQRPSTTGAVKFESTYQKKGKAEHTANIQEVHISEQISKTFESIPDASIGCVRERHHNENEIVDTEMHFVPKEGFPKVRKINIHKIDNQQSLFSQRSSKFAKVNKSVSSSSSSSNQDQAPSCLDKMKDEIHKSNLSVISGMSKNEIKNVQEKYIQSLDSALIAFLKSRKPNPPPTAETSSADKQKDENSECDIREIPMPTELLKEADVNQWLGFDKVEIDKLAWMRNIAAPKDKKVDKFEARFDFKGWLMPYSLQEIDEKSRTLYHHGEDPGRPGYTLQELFHLARSDVMQQRIIALNTIANILHLHSLGIYQDIIDIPIEQIFFVVRFCLDDNTPGVLSASLKTIHNMIVHKTDELCLDVILSFGLGKVQPILSVDDDDRENYTDNDQQIIEKNLIKCLIRTNILNRIRYILCTMKPCLEDVGNSLEILIRLARDSRFIFDKILRSGGLVEYVIKTFMPVHINFNARTNEEVVLPEAIKLVRILASRDKLVAEDIAQKYNIFEALSLYLTSDQYYMNSEGLKIRTESFHLWSTFIHYKIGIEPLKNLHPVLMKLLHYYANQVNVEQLLSFMGIHHLATCIGLLNEMILVEPSWIASFLSPLVVCLIKWSLHFVEKDKLNYPILCALFTFFSNYIKCNPEMMSQLSETLNELLLKIVSSSKFSQVTKDISNGSMLLSQYDNPPCSANFKTLQTSIWLSPECIIPIMRTDNCIPFLTCLSRLILCTGSHKVNEMFFTHNNIQAYVKKLEGCAKFNFMENWFTKLETDLILNILKCSVRVSKCLLNVYSLAMTVLPLFNTQQIAGITFIFRNIIFSEKFISQVLQHQDMETSVSELLHSVKESLPDILEVYLQMLNLKQGPPDFSLSLSVDIKKGNLIPIDWIYSSIIVLYTNNSSGSVNNSEEDQLSITKNCLKWNLFFEYCLSPMNKAIKVTERFCRLACVFLVNDSMFLDPEIHKLLEECFRKLMTVEDKIDFESPIQGLSGFEDFYKQLLEQYQGVSYGDVLFANIILIPLAQRHNVKWRKTLWSEYGGVVQTLFISESQVMLNIESLLNPVEADMSLIKSYKRAVSTNMVKRNSILYKIACHHIQNYLAKEESMLVS